MCATISSQRAGSAVRAGVVEQRRHRLADQVVQRGGLDLVPAGRVGHAVRRRDGPAVRAVVPLVPPAVPDRQVQAAVERGLHARGAARLQRPQRVVQPHVAALHQGARQGHVVVGQEHDPVPDPRVVGEPHHLLDQLLAAVVGGVRLAGDHDLHRPLRVEQQLGQPLRVAQHQRQPLVGRHPAGEADRQHVLVQRRRRSRSARPRRRRAGARRRAAAAGPRPPAGPRSTAADLPDPAGPRPIWAQAPVLGSPAWPPGAGTVRGRAPRQRRGSRCATQVGACTPLVTEPIGTSAVSNPGHRPGEHLPADRAVQLAHAVHPLGQPHAHHGHVEHGSGHRPGRSPRRAPGPGRTAAPGPPLAPPNCRSTSSRANRSMPAGTGVWVVNTVPARHQLQRLVEAQPGPRQLADPLQAEEARRGPRWCGTPRAAGAR